MVEKISSRRTISWFYFGRTKEKPARAEGPADTASAALLQGLCNYTATVGECSYTSVLAVRQHMDIKLLEAYLTDRAGGDPDGRLAFGELAGAGAVDCLRGEHLTLVIEQGGKSKIFFQNSRPCHAN